MHYESLMQGGRRCLTLSAELVLARLWPALAVDTRRSVVGRYDWLTSVAGPCKGRRNVDCCAPPIRSSVKTQAHEFPPPLLGAIQ
jgi:hypothetical protein